MMVQGAQMDLKTAANIRRGAAIKLVAGATRQCQRLPKIVPIQVCTSCVSASLHLDIHDLDISMSCLSLPVQKNILSTECTGEDGGIGCYGCYLKGWFLISSFKINLGAQPNRVDPLFLKLFL
jgi:hypothetical protein